MLITITRKPLRITACYKLLKRDIMKRLFYFRWYAFSKIEAHHNPKMLTKYFASVGIFGKQLDFRFMTQADTWFFRCENLHAWWLKLKSRIRYERNGELPF